MNYRTLGNTGLKVSVLGYGGSSLGAVFHEIDEADGPPQWHPAPAELRAACAAAARHCAARGGDLAKLALQFAVANPDIHVKIVGSANPRRILENIRQIAEPPDEQLLREAEEILRPVRNLTWPSGRPENN